MKLKHIRANVKFNFQDAGLYSKEFHVALVNEIIKAGVKHVNKTGFNIDVKEIVPFDVGYNYSEED